MFVLRGIFLTLLMELTMTKAILNESELTKQNITQLLSQLSITEQNTYCERQEIISKFPPNDEEFTLIE